MKAKRLKRKLNVTNTSIIKKTIKEEMSESNTYMYIRVQKKINMRT